jgi:hypothetical protein
MTHITSYDDSYPTCERTMAEFRVYPGDINPDEVTQMLGLEPTSTQRMGGQSTNSLGRVRISKKNGWFLSSENSIDSLDLRRHLDWLLEKIEPSAEAITQLQRTTGVSMTVHCVWWSAHGEGGPTLWPIQMRRLAALDLECGFEIAFYGSYDEQVL